MARMSTSQKLADLVKWLHGIVLLSTQNRVANAVMVSKLYYSYPNCCTSMGREFLSHSSKSDSINYPAEYCWIS